MNNKYPRGKLNESDEGASAIAIYVQDKTVIVNFGKNLSWFGVDKFQAIKIGEAIIHQANTIKTEDDNV